MKGSGMPVTGIRPMTMPTFTSTWKKIMVAMPQARNIANGSLERHALTSKRHMSSVKRTRTTSAPMKPSSSDRTPHTKSVVATGRSTLPLVKPLPARPPVSTASFA